jgi:hypothetical protein
MALFGQKRNASRHLKEVYFKVDITNEGVIKPRKGPEKTASTVCVGIFKKFYKGSLLL